MVVQRSLLILIILGLAAVVSAKPDNFNNQDLRREINMLDILNLVTNIPYIPSGAPPTNDGFAYSQISFTNTTLYIAGQNGYDVCGRLVPQDYDYPTGTSHALTRIAISFLNIAIATECFNMNITQVPGIIMNIANTWNDSRLDPTQRVDYALFTRSLANFVQLYFWPNQPKMTREYTQIYVLSRGDTFEVQPMPTPRIHADQANCLQTGIPPRSAVVLANWTLTGNPPADLDAFLFSLTGYHIGRGLGSCDKPELRNDDWSLPIAKAPRFGDAGDLGQAEPWNPYWIREFCLAIPARVDSDMAVPAANLFVRVQGNPQNPAVLLIHGTSASNVYMRGVANLLARYYFVVTPDLRGHAQSQVTPATVPANGGFTYTAERFGNDLLALMDQLNVTGKFSYGGISIGSSIGLYLAANHSDRIKDLILMSGTPQFLCPTAGDLTCAPWVTQQPFTPITMLPEDVLSGCNVTDARAKVDQNRQANTSGVAVANLVEYLQKANLSYLLPNIKAPTLIMRGLADVVPPAASDILHSSIVNSVKVDLVNRGHLFPITAYIDSANAILRFLQSDSLPEVTRVLDRGCQIVEEVRPQFPFDKCPSV
jgi:pimeloyl-ACP methyl ester carboxylesterase